MLGWPPVKTRRPPLRTAVAAALLMALISPGRVPVSRADVTPPLLPPKRDTSTTIDSDPAPLLMPGRPNPGDSEHRTREQRAREQYEMGRALEEDGAPGAAIAAYRNAVRLDPKLRDAHFRMGRLFAAVGQHGAAVPEFAAEVQLDPGNTRAARELGISLAHAGDTTSAIRQLEMLTRRNPRDTASWKGLGFAYGLARRNADAERALRKATELDPRDAAAWRDLGLVLALEGRAPAARDAYARAAKLAPRDGSALLNLGNLEAREGRWPQALEAYQAAERRDSTLLLAYAGQVRVLRELKRDVEAGEVYRRWLAVKPDAPGTRMDAIRLFTSLGRPDVALELARDGVRANPKSGEAHLALAMALEATDDVPGMLQELRKAEELLKQPEQRDRLAATIASLRAKAPDSLRAVYSADSLAHAKRPAPAAGAPAAAADSLHR